MLEKKKREELLNFNDEKVVIQVISDHQKKLSWCPRAIVKEDKSNLIRFRVLELFFWIFLVDKLVRGCFNNVNEVFFNLNGLEIRNFGEKKVVALIFSHQSGS